MPFAKGQSGNPAGRPKGVATKQTKLRGEIAKHVPGIVAKTVELAMAGDTTAIKILLDRVMPALKPTELPVAVTMGDGLAESGKAVLDALGASRMTPDDATKIMQVIGAQAKIVESLDLEQRLSELEDRVKVNGDQATH